MVSVHTSEQIKQGYSTPDVMQTVLSQSHQGLFVVGANSVVSFCNSHLAELVHIDPLQVVGQSYSVLFNQMANASHNPQRAEARLFAAATNLDALGEQEIRLQLVAAPETHVRIQFFPIHMPVDGQLARVAWGGIVLDVTAEWNETERWNEDLTVLTRGLRSTIANLKGAVTMLLSGHRYWEQSERQTFLESIDEHVDQLNRLLDNAQEMFKLDADTIELERRDTALERLIQRVTQSLVYQKSGHQFVLDIPGDLPNLEIDPLRVEQVFANLLDNAVLFSSREKTVHIKAFQADEEIQVSMTDQSAGMSVEDVNRILEGSLQINTSSAEASRGAEIGLYVARGLILAHGGSIWAESISQTGVITHFTLPIKARASSTGTAGTQRHITTLTPPPSTNGLEIRPNREIAKVLVVDDDAQMLRLLMIKLEAEGFEVITASRGNNALDRAVVEQPDVILLDVSLPDSNGFELCKRFREFTSVPIIMITGQSREEDMVRGLDAGADDYLVKPVRNKELLARVRANVRRARVPEQAPSKPIFRLNDLLIDFAQRQVVVRNQSVRLTPIEYKLLYHLAVNAGRILTHSQLLSKVWGPGYEEDTQYLWVNISRLRGKIEYEPSSPEYILTEPGVGYYLPDNEA